MLKFSNPYFKSAVEVASDALAPQVNAWLKTQVANKTITLAELRAGLPAIAAQLDRQTVNQIAADLNLFVQNPEDPTP